MSGIDIITAGDGRKQAQIQTTLLIGMYKHQVSMHERPMFKFKTGEVAGGCLK
jgi:hypothetical protein